MVETRDPYNGVRQFRYDEADQLVAAMGGAGDTTRYEYDENGRAVRIIDPMGGVTHRTFDAMGRCTSETDQLGNTSYASYDAAGRFIKNVDADGHVIEVGYDEAGLESSLSADGRLVSRTRRDALKRTSTVEDFADPGGAVTHTLSYDPRGLLVRHDREGASAASTSWAYDADGLPVRVTVPNGEATTYRRDAAGAVVAVEHPGMDAAVLERDEAGRLVGAAVGATSHEWAFTDGFITRHTRTGDGGSSASVMDYTEDGRLASVTTDGATTTYSYDASGQLTAAAGPKGTNTWAYDAGGRLTLEKVDGTTWKRTYNAAGRLLRATSDRESVTYTYDRSGRRTGEEHSDGRRRELEWGPLWTLASVTDHHHDRVVRTTTTVDALGRLARVNSERVFFDDVSGGLLQTGRDCVVRAGPLTAHARTGWLGASWRPERPTDPADPYRPPAPQATTGPIGIGAGGEVRVAGLEWTGARVLDPATSGFLSPDPMEPTTGAGWTGNPYSYAGNNPANLLDPTGLHPVYAAELDEYRKANSPKWGTALAIAAGVGLAVFGGPAGIGAAIAIGAALGAGGNLIDQACSGYPVNAGEVLMSGALGALGGGIGAKVAGLLGPLAGGPLSRLSTSAIGSRLAQGGIGAGSGGVSGFVTGGLGALATGGDFWQGAWNGAKDGAISGFAGGTAGRPPRPSTRFKGATAKVCTSTSVARNPNDIGINPIAPRAKQTTRGIGKSPTQNQWVQDRINYLKSIGATDFRVDQHQVNAQRQRVGQNRPDIQYTYEGTRYYEEVDTNVSSRGPGHADRTLANDPDGVVYLWTVD